MKWTVSVLLTMFVVLVPTCCAEAATYEVGPGKPLLNIGDVPWESLEAGDTVLIHWRSAPYKEKWVMCLVGTETQPITVRGVAGPEGEMPVIDGVDATTRKELDFDGERAVVIVGSASVPQDTQPAHIVIENLDIRGAHPDNFYYDSKGKKRQYSPTASALWIEKGDHITVRNCAFSGSAHGFFTSWRSSEVLVEGCYVHDNGNAGDIYTHNIYTESRGIVFQYNHIAPMVAGSLGSNLQDRSAGTIIRYNWIEGGDRQMDIVESDHEAVRADPRYSKDFVYGNVLIEPVGDGNNQMISYGGDMGTAEWYRPGPLQFYNNTVISHRSDRTYLVRPLTDSTVIDVYNNVVVGTTDAPFYVRAEEGRVNISHNWFQTGYVAGEGVHDDGTSVTGSDPGFVDIGGNDFHLKADSACVNAGMVLTESVPAEHNVVIEYVKGRSGRPRPSDGKLDIGAYEHAGEAAQAGAVLSTAPAARMRYVSVDGSDSNDGSAGAPWATLQHAVDSVSAGDTIIVKDGTYAGCLIGRGGEPGRPVVLKAENKWGAVIRGFGAKKLRNSLVGINDYDFYDHDTVIGYVTVDGFEIDAEGADNGIRTSHTEHVTIANCKVYDSTWVCINPGHSDYIRVEGNVTFGSKKSHGMYMANTSAHGVVRGNTSYSNAKSGLHMNGDLSCGGAGVITDWLIEKNVVFDNHGGGAINCDGVSDSVFRNNLLYDNHATGMTFYAIDATEGSSRNLVANNTIMMASDGRWPILMPRMKKLPPIGSKSVDQLPPLARKRKILSPTANRFYNNIIYHPSSRYGSILVYAGDVRGFESDYNITNGRYSADGGETLIDIDKWRSLGHGKHSIAADPKGIFVAPGANDYHLKKGSPAVDAGTALEDVTEDIEGTPRLQGAAYDIGCYEVKAD